MRLTYAVGFAAAIALLPHEAAAQATVAPDSIVADTIPLIPTELALSEDEIAEAIAWGIKNKKAYAYHGGSASGGIAGAFARSSEAVPGIYILGPFGRVATAAANAARRYQEFNRSMVADEDLLPFIVVRVEPPPPSRNPRMRSRQPNRIEHIVLQADDESVVVQPIETRSAPMSWQNGFGATFSGEGLTAIFHRDSIPDGGFYVVVISDAGEDRWPVGRRAVQDIR